MESKTESAKEDQNKEEIPGTTMNLRKFRKATAKKRQLLDKEVCKKKRKMMMINSPSMEEVKSESETSNTMTLEQFTDIVLASEGMTLNNNNEEEEKEELEKKAMVATILQNKDLTVEVKTAKSKPVVLSPRENVKNVNNSVVVSVKPRQNRYDSQNLVEEWLKKIPPNNSETPASSSALNLSVRPSGVAITTAAIPPIVSGQTQYSNKSAFNNTKMDGSKARAIRDIQLAHTKDMHGNYPLHMSVLMRKPELVKRYCCILFILEASLDMFNDEKHTPLHLAVRDNSVEIVEILLAFGANPSIRDSRGNTCLHLATAIRSSESLKLLAESVNSKDELNSFNNFGITPLHIAMMNDDKACVDILLRSGADPKILSDLINMSSTPKEVKRETTTGSEIDLARKNLLIHS